MGKCKDVSEWQNGTIVSDHAHDCIVSEVVKFVGVPQCTVQRVCKWWCNTRSHKTQIQNCGRKKILNERDRRHVSWLVLENRFQTRQELLQSVNEGPSPSVSERTL